MLNTGIQITAVKYRLTGNTSGIKESLEYHSYIEIIIEKYYTENIADKSVQTLNIS